MAGLQVRYIIHGLDEQGKKVNVDVNSIGMSASEVNQIH